MSGTLWTVQVNNLYWDANFNIIATGLIFPKAFSLSHRCAREREIEREREREREKERQGW
eukprot:3824053-Rhodomonas_salina.2